MNKTTSQLKEQMLELEDEKKAVCSDIDRALGFGMIGAVAPNYRKLVEKRRQLELVISSIVSQLNKRLAIR